jgi:ribonucleoside-diphosphate reductase beta chain
MKLKKLPIYTMNDEKLEDRRIFGGNPSSDINFRKTKYPEARKLYTAMENNTWFTKEVDLSADVKDYKNLLPPEKSAYDNALSQLVFMDNIQTANLETNILPYITAEEYRNCLIRQTYEELNHSINYAVLIDTISDNPDEIYKKYKTNPMLKEKNDTIMKIYEDLGNDVDELKLTKAFFANLALEGIYFNSGFAYFYTLAKTGKMLGTSIMIKFIDRDETTHLMVFTNMINNTKKERPYLFTNDYIDDYLNIIKSAVELEIKWGQSITNGEILGLNDELIEKYIKYLANQRCKAVDLPLLYEDIKNPLFWINKFKSFNDIKGNFFESTVINYKKGDLDLSNLQIDI